MNFLPCPFCGESKEVYEIEGEQNLFGIYVGSYTANKVTVSCWTCGGKMTTDVDLYWEESFQPSLSDMENLQKVRKLAIEYCLNKWNKRYTA